MAKKRSENIEDMTEEIERIRAEEKRKLDEQKAKLQKKEQEQAHNFEQNQVENDIKELIKFASTS